MFSFYAAPVVGDQFPSGLAPGRATDFLPVIDLLAAHFLMRAEFADRPMGAVFGGLGHGLQMTDRRRAGNEKPRLCRRG